jgi:hypothetical protein
MQPCKLVTGSLIGSGILPPGQFLNVHKIRVDSDNKRLARCTKKNSQTSDLDLSQTGVCPGDLFFRPQRNKPNSYSSYKTKDVSPVIYFAQLRKSDPVSRLSPDRIRIAPTSGNRI